MSNSYHLVSLWVNVSTWFLVISPIPWLIPPPSLISENGNSIQKKLPWSPLLSKAILGPLVSTFTSLLQIYSWPSQSSASIPTSLKSPLPLPCGSGHKLHVSAFTFSRSLSTHTESGSVQSESSSSSFENIWIASLYTQNKVHHLSTASKALSDAVVTYFVTSSVTTPHSPPPQPYFLLQLPSASSSPSMHRSTDPWEWRPVCFKMFLYTLTQEQCLVVSYIYSKNGQNKIITSPHIVS